MYKKILITVSIVFSSIFIYSQNHIEALRYSQQFYSTTAKAEAMGNALSAVGADMSSMLINPAGIGIYNSSQFAVTPNFVFTNTEGDFFGNIRNENKFGMTISNIGYVGVIEMSGIVKNVNFGIAYNSTNDFRQRTIVSAEGQNGSILDFIVYNENMGRAGIREDLAWRGWLYNYDSGLDEYWSFVTDDGTYGITQRNEIVTRGGMGETSFSFAANIGDRLYIGSTIGLSSINYKEESSYRETDFPYIETEDVDNPGNFIQVNPVEIDYKQSLITEGFGFNAKAGFIFQPIKLLRIAGAIHSPTFYSVTEDYLASMYIEYPTADDFGYYDYEPDTANIFEYRVRTPFRANAGVALILDSYEIGKFFTIPMIFSLDYEFVDYRLATLLSDYYSNDDFDDANSDAVDLFKETHNFRAGAEVNLGALKIRGGYALYSSPFAADENFENAKVIYSGGLGFASNNAFVDFSYSYSVAPSTLYMYNANVQFPNNPIGNINEPAADLKINKQFFKITMGLRF